MNFFWIMVVMALIGFIGYQCKKIAEEEKIRVAKRKEELEAKENE